MPYRIDILLSKLLSVTMLLGPMLFPAFGYGAEAGTVEGKVIASSGMTAKLAVESGGVPKVGDSVYVFSKVAGFEVEFPVAWGQVSEVSSGAVTVKIDKMNSLVAKDQLARISPAGSVFNRALSSTSSAGSSLSANRSLSANLAMVCALAGWLAGMLGALALGRRSNTA